MIWQPDLIIGVATNAITALIGFSLMFIVLGASRQLDNGLFALLMLFYAIIGTLSVFMHFAQPLEFHPRHALYVTTSLYAIGIVLLFVVGARFAGISNRIIGPLGVLGLVVIVYLLIPLWDGRVYTDFEPAANGAQYHYKFGAVGVPGLAVLGVYQLLSAITLYWFGNERGRGLWVAPVVLLVGMLMFLIPFFDRFPKNAIAISLSALIMARIVTHYHIFNPFAQLNRQLADANAVKSKLLDQLTATNEQLIEANQLKSKFLANMSHELRTPLNSIIGYTEMLISQTYGELTATQTDRLERIERNGRNLLALINDILDLSKIEAGQMDLVLESLNLRDVIASVLDEIGGQVEQKPVAIAAQSDETLPNVLADRGRARQIITNLVGNAIKFTDQGSVTVTARSHPARGMVEVAVTDTGIGIPADQQSFIFDEFRQADDSPTRLYEGTGLGLAISKRLVVLMGGTIWVESAVGQGSTFTFTLPVANR